MKRRYSAATFGVILRHLLHRPAYRLSRLFLSCDTALYQTEFIVT